MCIIYETNQYMLATKEELHQKDSYCLVNKAYTASCSEE